MLYWFVYSLVTSNDFRNEIVFSCNNWNDYSYYTSFDAFYFDPQGKINGLGTIKIARVLQQMREPTFRILQGTLGKSEDAFSLTKLPDEFFSLWQSADSYETVRNLSVQLNCKIFADLNDVAYDLELLDQYRRENVLKKSLLRYAPENVCRKQFHRITLGEAKLTEYHFSFQSKKYQDAGTTLDFDVYPDSFPPTNVHAIIGGNGVGKTYLLKSMIEAICSRGISSDWEVLYKEGETERFSNVMCISFSPFDDYSNIEKSVKEKDYLTFIGTKKDYSSKEKESANLLTDIRMQFIDSFSACYSNLTKKNDLKQVIGILETDPMFNQYKLERLIDSEEHSETEILTKAEEIFASMSSGHKVVLSIMVKCIDKLVEKTIVFLDEPENHLHPPLLASLIRSLSTMLIKRNGAAIIATHSPIVLQEIPRSCVWHLSRRGGTIHGERPPHETFGENIGILTNGIFRYEISNSGFHAMLKESVARNSSYSVVLNEFKGQLGEEAKTLVRILLSQKKEKGSDD